MNIKPEFKLVQLDNNSKSVHQNGGNKRLTEEQILHGAKKYHYKCQMKIREIMANGQQCPAGYEKYLEPFTI